VSQPFVLFFLLSSTWAHPQSANSATVVTLSLLPLVLPHLLPFPSSPCKQHNSLSSTWLWEVVKARGKVRLFPSLLSFSKPFPEKGLGKGLGKLRLEVWDKPYSRAFPQAFPQAFFSTYLSHGKGF
jgi:hypothetical protein